MTEPGQPIDPTIRSVSDEFLAEIDALIALEERKRTTPVDDPTFLDLAHDVEARARALLAKAREQASTATDVHEEAVAAGSDVTIEEIPPDLSPADILAQWRDADRERATLEPGSARWRLIGVRIDQLRDAYQRAYGRDR